MKVAVLMSTYNGEKYLRAQIDSVLNQEGDFLLQLIVRDDGSVDGTLDILQEYADKGLLSYYQGEKRGPALSFMDLLFHVSDNDYYAFADQDDVWNTDKLSVAIHMLQTCDTIDKAKLYCSNALLVDKALVSLGRNVYKKKPKTDFCTLSCAGGLMGCTMVFNHALRAILIEHRVPQINGIVMHDFFMAMLCVGTGGKIVYDSSPSLRYRLHDRNTVGVNHGFWQTLRNRIRDVFHAEKVSIADQAKSLLDFYEDCLLPEYADWLHVVSEYHGSLRNRIKLSLSHKTRYINFNMGLRLRAAIFLSNR